MNRPHRRAAALALPVLLSVCRPSAALDPNRALTRYVYRIRQAQQGLPQPTIYSIPQDARGDLWLGRPIHTPRVPGFRPVRDSGVVR